MQSLPLPRRGRENDSERPLAQVNHTGHKTKTRKIVGRNMTTNSKVVPVTIPISNEFSPEVGHISATPFIKFRHSSQEKKACTRPNKKKET